MGLFTALFASRRGARTLVLDAWRIGDSRAASYSLTRSIRSDYLDPLYARLAHGLSSASALWANYLLARAVGRRRQLPRRPDWRSEATYFVPPLEKREQFMP